MSDQGRRRSTAGAAALVAALAAAGAAAQAQEPGRISAARFDEAGRLVFPADVETWVHVGSSIGLAYREGVVDQSVMNVVTMEPAAYRYFMEHGTFADGTMFHLEFHAIVKDEKLASEGVATGPIVGTEIHLKDSARFPGGFDFYTFAPGQASAAEVPLPNACVECHAANGDYDGTFTQFYPAIKARLEK